MRKYYSLYGRLLNDDHLKASFRRVQKAKGAAGIDGQNLSDYAQNLDVEIQRLLVELRGKTYKPFPVKRVKIPKADGGTRSLGIPAVRDRVVQQAF